MAKSVGTKILQYDLNNILINNFVSFADALDKQKFQIAQLKNV